MKLMRSGALSRREALYGIGGLRRYVFAS